MHQTDPTEYFFLWDFHFKREDFILNTTGEISNGLITFSSLGSWNRGNNSFLFTTGVFTALEC